VTLKEMKDWCLSNGECVVTHFKLYPQEHNLIGEQLYDATYWKFSRTKEDVLAAVRVYRIAGDVHMNTNDFFDPVQDGDGMIIKLAPCGRKTKPEITTVSARLSIKKKNYEL